MELTAAKVSEYISRNAFASIRVDAASSSQSASSMLKSVKTDSIRESMKLLSGADERMGTILANLKEMLSVANGATSYRAGVDKKNEAYATLRSLGAGVDTIVSKTTFDGQTVLNGCKFNLNSAGGYSKMLMSDLTTTGAKGLDLATQSKGAEMVISYDDFSEWNNTHVGLQGLDISAVRYSGNDKTFNELDSGQYVIEVVYGGKDSSLIVKDLMGKELSRADGVDLSGSGIETVSLDLGLELDIEKSRDPKSNIDKYDFESKGRPSLLANLDYVRVTTYDLSGSSQGSGREASLGEVSRPVKDSGGAAFSITGASLGQISKGVPELESGQYNVEVSKYGDKVSGILYDKSGRMVGRADAGFFDKDGTSTLDFGKGLVLSVNNDGLSGNAEMKAIVNYSRSSEIYDNFDFQAYADRIQAAIDLVTDQKKTVGKAFDQVENVYNALSGASGNTGSELVKSLLGADSGTSLVSMLTSTPSTASAQLSWTSGLITNNLTNALGVQSSDGTSILSLLSGTTDMIDPSSLPSTLKLARK
ncbi:MAG: hypothetical protein WC360_07970 [Opitutales bacterium]|jgi:hypothetical protein